RPPHPPSPRSANLLAADNHLIPTHGQRTAYFSIFRALRGPPARLLSMRIHTAPDANIPTTSTTTPSHIGRMISAKKTRPANVAASTNPTRDHRRTSRGGIPRYMPKPLSTQSGKAPPEGNHLILGTVLATTLGAFRAVPGTTTLKIMPTTRAATKPKIAARILTNQTANRKRGT